MKARLRRSAAKDFPPAHAVGAAGRLSLDRTAAPEGAESVAVS